MKFLAFPMWRLFKGGVYFEITFLNHRQQLLKIVCKYYVIQRFQFLPYFAEIELKCLDGVNYQVVPRFFLLFSSKRRVLLTRGGVYSRRRLLVILLPSAVFNRGRRLIRGTQCQFSQIICSEDDLKKKKKMISRR